MTESLQTFRSEAREFLEAYLARPGYEIPAGIGTENAACSVAAINLAITGELTDTIPPCMSEVIGNWIITVQDAIPTESRNSPEWRALLPDAAASGRDPAAEKRRLAIVVDWMWTALEQCQTLADKGGYGNEWRAMCEERTDATVNAVRTAARAAGDCGVSAVNAARAAAGAAAGASWAAAGVSEAATHAARASDAARAARNAVEAGAWGAVEPGWTTEDADKATSDAWMALDPAGTLKRLIAV